MSDLHKKRLLILFWLVVATTVLLPVFFGEARNVTGQVGGDRWRNFIYDFQTLIGGGAAIIAAWYTVRQMRISDERSEQRHRELVGLQLRADRLRVERLLFPALHDLEDSFNCISRVNLTAVRELISMETQSGRSVVESLQGFCNDAYSILQRRQFKDAFDLFDGDLAFRYGKTVDQILNLRAASGLCLNYFDRLVAVQREIYPDVFGRATIEVTENLDRLRNLRRDLLIDFADMLVCLEYMKKEYGIH